ncbi:MAG: response regulator [Alphaproteobacteria bacterium]|nr:response regulator [Alphaproteobacteria bacterium]
MMLPSLPFRLSQARILVVDDSELSLRLIENSLIKKGFSRVDTARDGMEALDKTRNAIPDLVILDLVMPGMDGFAYCEQVRADGSLPRMPIIVQTAAEEREFKLRALSTGADDFLHKPVDQEELDLRVRLHLQRYFGMEDMHEVCDYLRMELEQAQKMIAHLQASNIHPDAATIFEKHLDVLKTITVLPGYGKAQ